MRSWAVWARYLLEVPTEMACGGHQTVIQEQLRPQVAEILDVAVAVDVA